MNTIRNAKVLDSRVICKQPGRYIGWPTIAKTRSGELLAVFSGDRDAHVDPFGKTFLIRSGDGGMTWAAPELVNDTPLDDRDAGICVCADGTVVVSWFTSHYLPEHYLKRFPEGNERWSRHLKAITPEAIRRWAGETLIGNRYVLGCWIRRSTDGGRTWEDPVRVPATTPHGPIELSDGRLMFVGIEGNQRQGARRDQVVAAESRDRGRSWSVLARIPAYPAYTGTAPDGYAYLCEPHVVEVAPGRLLAMARYEEVPRAPQRCVLWQFTSADGGRTWTQPAPTPIVGKPPHLVRLRNGCILVSYGYRHEPFGQRACLSGDGGNTWDYDREIVLRDDAPSGDLGYPATVELDDGVLLTVYYQQEQAGEKTCLMATRWRL